MEIKRGRTKQYYKQKKKRKKKKNKRKSNFISVCIYSINIYYYIHICAK